MLKRLSSLSSVSLLLCALSVACGDDKNDDDPKIEETDGDPDGDPDGSPDAGNDDEDGSDEECDPEGANKPMGVLLNAQVGDDVEVVVKQPKHPGKPGPLNLP